MSNCENPRVFVSDRRSFHSWMKIQTSDKTITYECSRCGKIQKRWRPGHKPTVLTKEHLKQGWDFLTKEDTPLHKRLYLVTQPEYEAIQKEFHLTDAEMKIAGIMSCWVGRV